MRNVAMTVVLLGALLAGCVSADTSSRVSRIDPLDQGLQLLLAEDYAAARAHFEAMYADDPDNPYVNLALGVAVERTGEMDRARSLYETAVQIGKTAEVAYVVEQGADRDENTTVAALAQANLERMGNL